MEKIQTAEPPLLDISAISTTFFSFRADLADIDGLQRSIAEKGLIQPILVRPHGGVYELVCGHRRLEACRRLGWRRIPAMVTNASAKSAFEMALVENLQRCSLYPIEEAEAFRRYIEDYGWGGVSELADRIGKSEEFVSHRVLLLNLPESVRDRVSRRQLSPSLATELVWIQDGALQETVAEMVVQEGMTVRETRQVVGLVRRGGDPRQLLYGLRGNRFPSLDVKVKCLVELKSVIVSCRTSLFAFDHALDELRSAGPGKEGLSDMMMEKRVELHDLIDDLIKEKVRLEKEIRRLGY